MAITKTDVYDVQAPFPLDLRIVRADIASRDAIPMNARYAGMWVQTLSPTERYWRWPQGGTSNSSWEERVIGGGGTALRVYWFAAPPDLETGGNGDLWYHEQASTITMYQKQAGAWNLIGVFPKADGTVTATSDPSVEYGMTSAQLTSAYPAAKPGDMVYNKSSQPPVLFTKLAGADWKVEITEIP